MKGRCGERITKDRGMVESRMFLLGGGRKKSLDFRKGKDSGQPSKTRHEGKQRKPLEQPTTEKRRRCVALGGRKEGHRGR